MNILQLRSSGGFFGAEGVILNLSKGLSAAGINNHIICIKNSTNPHEELTEEARKLGLKTDSIICKGRFDFKTILYIRGFIKQNKIDILHCHDYKANFMGLCASLFLNVKLVATNHLWTKETLILRFYEFIDAMLLNFFDRIVAVSEQIEIEIRKMLLGKKKLITIFNGIDIDKYSATFDGSKIRKEFQIGHDTKIIGTIGRLTPQKGINYLLDAAKKVLSVFPEVKFLIVGDGISRKTLEEQSQDLGIKKSVVFTGNRKDMRDVYESLDLFVLFSIREGSPLVLLEALAMAKPVIATDVGGVSSIIKNGETGILSKPRDISAISNAIIELLRDKNRAETLANNGRKFIEDNFSINNMTAKYLKLYEDVLSSANVYPDAKRRGLSHICQISK